MRQLSTLFALSLFLYTAISANAVVAAEDGFDGPTWEATFGNISPEEMTNDKYMAYRRLFRSVHLDPSQNADLASLWELNGTLPLIDTGYFLLSKNAAEKIHSTCLYNLPSNENFCIASSKEVRLLMNDSSLSDKIRHQAYLITVSDIKKLSSKEIDALKSDALEAQDKIINSVSDDKVPPIQYVRLGMLKGYLEGLDPHSNLSEASEFRQVLKHRLEISKQDNVITIKFDRFGTNLTKDISEKLKLIYASGDRILLDLRDNGGGILREAQELTLLFLGPNYSYAKSNQMLFSPLKGEDIAVKLRMPKTTFETYYTEAPLAVLVNQHSASASEITAGLLQQEGRALVIGNQTYGKGTYLDVMPVVTGKVIATITERFTFMREGRTAQINGIIPDLGFPLSEEEVASSVREGDYANALKTSDSVKIDAPARVELNRDLKACAKNIWQSRGGYSTLKSTTEVQILGETYLKQCFALTKS